MEKFSYDIRTYSPKVQASFTTTNNFINNEDYYNRLLTLTSMCPKLVIAGSLSLHLLGVMSIDFQQRKPDMDFALTEPLEEEEFDLLKSFFEFEVMGDIYDNEEDDVNNSYPTSKLLKRKVIRLWDKKSEVYIDIFNGHYDNDFSLKQENLIPINFRDNKEPHIVYVQHPSVTISHKAKYAFYEDYRKSQKHQYDLIDLLTKGFGNRMKQTKRLVEVKSKFVKVLEMKHKSLEDFHHYNITFDNRKYIEFDI